MLKKIKIITKSGKEIKEGILLERKNNGYILLVNNKDIDFVDESDKVEIIKEIHTKEHCGYFEGHIIVKRPVIELGECTKEKEKYALDRYQRYKNLDLGIYFDKENVFKNKK